MGDRDFRQIHAPLNASAPGLGPNPEHVGRERIDPPFPEGRWLRLLAIAAAALALIFGLRAGLLRLGWDLPGNADATLHGPLMICGFLGTVISLERAVAARRIWAYGAPAASALGAVALATGYVLPAQAAFVVAGVVLLGVSVAFCLRVPALFTGMLAIAAAAWGVGSVLWAMGSPVAIASGWWLAFLIITIAAERVELSRIVEPPRWSGAVLTIGAALILLGAARGELARNGGEAYGAGLLVIAICLARFDVARFTIRQRQQARFSAFCVLAGYVWLAASGLLLAFERIGTWAFAWAFTYDAALHMMAIGFVFSMIFAHAPTIVPVIVGSRPAYTALLYGPLGLLHVSLALRVAGDLLESVAARNLSGALTVLAVLTYAAALASASLRQRR
jgi:hypothetical protein